ncbi:GNAT family N-acetyltransferase [Ornithinimicrobium cryptoxanthini]|uniref:N-acetyltransferase n=1 Tax=Ornithinimicrobium cryptoxanthini TaxID=2934161 RepID=A0ABY4YLQ0_9MICO|nr:GNAT family N-acetyltransferase [Ornithinimicrobium cryptoxanthini]USQ77445.1 N-acetyltransferase [Ornithinimicrobium cryptoxanthini]
MEPEVTKQTGPDRFELTVDGTTAGFAQFVDHDGSRVFYHTEVFPEFGGQGLAGVMVKEALGATREEGLRIVPVCPYVKKYVTKHEEWTDHVDRPTREMLHAIPKDS